ncbi:MAG: alpha/beta hydrolase [Pirellulaceae bacterium]|nr:alpha/beta hydrolase [Pirellulaceae bacterium]
MPVHYIRGLVCLLAICASACGLPTLVAQNGGPVPTHRDLPYDDANQAQRMDVYLVDAPKEPVPVMIHFHGGGWRAGTKDRVPAWLLDGVSQGRWSVASVEYRFTDVKPHPAQVNDCLRSIQFVRQHAEEWKIDPKRVGVTGGSAGGHLSLWVALHDDVADPNATNPVEKQSSRVACAVSFAGPTDWSLLSQITHTHPAYRQLIGYDPKTPAGEMDEAKKKDVSPISFVSNDDPPIMQVHGDKDDIVPIEHAHKMNEKLQALKVRTELVVVPGGNHGVSGAAPAVSPAASKFVQEIFSLPAK